MIGIGGHHDLGGVESFEPINIVDTPLDYWEISIHALLVILASKSPPMITTDELRRTVENLEESAYENWGYYDKWAAAMTSILLERNVITQTEIDQELNEHSPSQIEPIDFQIGDIVRVKKEDSRLRWRRPHIRCPGYIFGATGVIERIIGEFKDPFLLAFRGEGSTQRLYRVRFQMNNIWTNVLSSHDSSTTSEDTIDVEIYQNWLERADSLDQPSPPQVEPPPTPSLDHISHTHIQHHDQHDDDHSHTHSHTQRFETEEISIHRELEGEGGGRRREGGGGGHSLKEEHTPGRVVGEALLRLLTKKNIISPETLTQTIERLEGWGKNMQGARLVARAWVDPSFRERLLRDAPSAGRELGISTSNPNAPTHLVVVENILGRGEVEGRDGNGNGHRDGDGDGKGVHNVVVCTLCSCYPASLLGLSPSWYKCRSYRCRMVYEPRMVLQEFGTILPPSTMTRIRVHDSTADCRYLVLPLRPQGTEDWSEEQLISIVTRDSMIGVTRYINI